MKFTLNIIKEKRPCTSGWKILLKSLNKTEADNEELDLIDVLKSNGIEDAIWCLRCFKYEDYCLFLADVAESVLHIYERKNKNTAPRDAITAIREYKLGNINKAELKNAADAAAAAAAAAADAATADAADAAAAAAAAYTADAAYTAATADAAYTADADAYTAYTAAAAADAADAYTADDAADDAAAARSAKWNEIKELFIKYFGNKLGMLDGAQTLLEFNNEISNN
ncbi:hypothetical protein KAR91_47850 [Candidatus Pacearchaeota archaeon]|nr:hypothetical protein [Candidatus Pacearchaeota archaeon]